MPGGRALGSVALDRVCDVVTLAVFLVIGLQAVPTPDVAPATSSSAPCSLVVAHRRSRWSSRGCTRGLASATAASAVGSAGSSATRSTCSASRSAAARRSLDRR